MKKKKLCDVETSKFAEQKRKKIQISHLETMLKLILHTPDWCCCFTLLYSHCHCRFFCCNFRVCSQANEAKILNFSTRNEMKKTRHNFMWRDGKWREIVLESSIFYCLVMITFIGNLFASMNNEITVKLSELKCWAVSARFTVKSV